MHAPLAFRVLGGADSRRDLVSYRKALARYADADPVIHPEIPAFLSAYTFPDVFGAHVKATGSTAGYAGPVGVPALRFDIDRDGDPDAALRDARRLAGHLEDRYGHQGLSVFFSGSKGYHLEADTAGAVEPATDAHLVARKLAETIAGDAHVTIDNGVYDRVHLWRAPNSRHPRTGLYKIRVELDDLLYATTAGVRRHAVEPIPYDPPAFPSAPRRLLEDWRRAETVVRRPADARPDRRGEAGGGACINALTRLLITRPEEIEVGDRHRLLYSAARNLSEFRNVDDMIFELLTPPGLDTALPPKEVERQIRCGIDDARRQRGEGGAA